MTAYVIFLREKPIHNQAEMDIYSPKRSRTTERPQAEAAGDLRRARNNRR